MSLTSLQSQTAVCAEAKPVAEQENLSTRETRKCLHLQVAVVPEGLEATIFTADVDVVSVNSMQESPDDF